MDDIYLIEIRLGRTKWRIRKTISRFGGLFSLESSIEQHPHVTLFGPLTLNEDTSPKQLIDTIGKITDGYGPLSFTIDGWELREGIHGSVIAFPVIPSEPLKNLTSSLAESLASLVQSQNIWDTRPENKWFHVTIANRLDIDRAQAVFSTLTGQKKAVPDHGVLQRLKHLVQCMFIWTRGHAVPPVTIDEHGLRLTIMRGDLIFAEFDLLENRWISGDYSHKGKSWQNSLSLFRQKSGFERSDPQPSNPEDIFLIGDLHLGHANIINYCSRPFLISDVREMDHVLIKNWNYTISPANRVYHLGDLRYGLDAPPAPEYRKKLKGQIIFIGGNHDEDGSDSVPSVNLEYQGFRFQLVHDPADVKKEFDGWIIHGHHHNNDLRNYPFIDFEHRRINVSAEVLGYIPVNLNHICTLINERLSNGNKAAIILNYPYVGE
jgi:calcineurin-like phosphoesterase family protein